ncbi:helix-turn-helix domain-containing protein [Komagataeibacter swingsii]|uniref:Helix-turn-helix transcriptional regulator n=1 Tax=Komagataeibacter swingsii TaxID=215220 RepID=A0A850P6R0_9PROT|nr:helix-turn-helix transcriptional regulator [Komagataeibacter swingsii]
MGESIANIGFSVGYESEAAFSTAFRRKVGCTPMQHRRLVAT